MTFVDISIKEISKKIKGVPVKMDGKVVGKVIGVNYEPACRHENARMDITAEITHKKMKEDFVRIRFV